MNASSRYLYIAGLTKPWPAVSFLFSLFKYFFLCINEQINFRDKFKYFGYVFDYAAHIAIRFADFEYSGSSGGGVFSHFY